MIRDLGQLEPVPGVRRQQRVDFDHVVSARRQAVQSRDRQIVERRVVVVAASFGLRAGDQPLAGLLVVILADSRLAILLVSPGVGFHLPQVVAASDELLRRTAQDVRQSAERLARREGPDGAIPFARSRAVRAELRVTLLGGGDAQRVLKPCGSLSCRSAQQTIGGGKPLPPAVLTILGPGKAADRTA